MVLANGASRVLHDGIELAEARGPHTVTWEKHLKAEAEFGSHHPSDDPDAIVLKARTLEDARAKLPRAGKSSYRSTVRA
jgi:hypothetical protein